ncbi:hypothetical protein PAPYR_10439 [Paratrimastix pyriformis]|uniref:Reverse transcriptase domain-containing protein n=1 Tax=Paratrimastix pyriformis TaxID=342808 RepID=A0ABQ8U5W9_9EUKA|nr:hypothetical protein PAPYR_10439 [Paratrimastix pyriformis]
MAKLLESSFEGPLTFDGEKVASFSGSPLAFALTYDHVVKSISAQAPTISIRGVRIPPVLAYLDDLYIITTTAEAQRLLDTCRSSCQELGIAVNGSKCWYWTAGPAPVALQVGEELVPRATLEDGLDLLGVCLGSPNASARAVKAAADAAVHVAELASPLTLQAFLLILRLSVVPRLTFQTRASGCGSKDLANFDDRILTKLLARLSLAREAVPSLERISLPIRFGGLGIQRMAPARDAALAGATISILTAPEVPRSIQETLWQIWEATAQQPELAATFLGLSAQSMHRLGISPGADHRSFEQHGTRLGPKKVQHTLWEESMTATAAASLESLPADARKMCKATMGPCASAFLQCFPCPLFELDDEEMRYAILLRLGVSAAPWKTTLGFGLFCPLCGEPLVEGHDRLCLAINHSLAIQRHNAWKLLVFNMATTARIGVRMERRLPGATAEERHQPDLVLEVPGVGGRHSTKTVFLDFIVGEVLAPSYAAEATLGNVPQRLEAGKVSAYKAFMTAYPDAEFLPAGATCTGQLGPGAEKAIDRIIAAGGKGNRISRRWWLARFSMVFVRFAYEMSCNWCQHASAAVAARDLQLAKSMATERITRAVTKVAPQDTTLLESRVRVATG